MSNNLWFDARAVVAGTADLKASGKELTEAFSALEHATARISELAAAKPAGTDGTGTDFDAAHQKLLDGFAEQGKQVGEAVNGIAESAEKALALFTKTDLENADDLNLD